MFSWSQISTISFNGFVLCSIRDVRITRELNLRHPVCDFVLESADVPNICFVSSPEATIERYITFHVSCPPLAACGTNEIINKKLRIWQGGA